jgi:hypothetical protein
LPTGMCKPQTQRVPAGRAHIPPLGSTGRDLRERARNDCSGPSPPLIDSGAAGLAPCLHRSHQEVCRLTLPCPRRQVDASGRPRRATTVMSERRGSRLLGDSWHPPFGARHAGARLACSRAGPRGAGWGRVWSTDLETAPVAPCAPVDDRPARVSQRGPVISVVPDVPVRTPQEIPGGPRAGVAPSCEVEESVAGAGQVVGVGGDEPRARRAFGARTGGHQPVRGEQARSSSTVTPSCSRTMASSAVVSWPSGGSSGAATAAGVELSEQGLIAVLGEQGTGRGSGRRVRGAAVPPTGVGGGGRRRSC